MTFLIKVLVVLAQAAFIGGVIYAINAGTAGYKFGSAPTVFAVGLCFWVTRWLFGLIDWLAARLSGVRPHDDATRYGKSLAASPRGLGQLPKEPGRPRIGQDRRDL